MSFWDIQGFWYHILHTMFGWNVLRPRGSGLLVLQPRVVHVADECQRVLGLSRRLISEQYRGQRLPAVLERDLWGNHWCELVQRLSHWAVPEYVGKRGVPRLSTGNVSERDGGQRLPDVRRGGFYERFRERFLHRVRTRAVQKPDCQPAVSCLPGGLLSV